MWEAFNRYVVPLVLGLCIGATLVLVILFIGVLRDATPPLESARAASWPDYWLNRYQTLIAGIAALVAALIAVQLAWRQGGRARADQAEQALTRYATAILAVMRTHEAATPPSGDETMEDAQKRLDALRDATDHPIMIAAMMDSVLGEDAPMIAMFNNSCRFSAVGHVYGKGDQTHHRNLIWPLYTALSNGISRRKALLREGARVSDLYTLSTIDQHECGRAFIEGRAPDLDKLQKKV